MMNDKIGLPGAVKLTDWAKEPSVLDLKNDLDASKPAHDFAVVNIRRWNDLRNVTGKYRPAAIKNRSQVQPKLIRRNAEWRYSALSEPFLSSENLFKVSPVTYEDVAGAQQNELVLNHQFRSKLNKVNFIDNYVRTAVDEGSVIVRVGWHRETRMEKVEVPVFAYVEATTEEELGLLQEAATLKQENPRAYLELPEEIRASVEYLIETGIPTVAQVVGREMVEQEKIVENKPTVDIQNADNVFIDAACQGDIDKANFAIISFETSKALLLKEGKRYKNLDAVNWSGNSILSEPDHKTETPNDYQLRDELRRPVVAYEYWGFYDVDGSETLTPIVATWIGDTLIRMERNPFPDEKIPLVVVPYLPVRGQLMGEPDAEILEDNQAIIGAVTRGMIDLMGRSANSQQGMPKGMLDVTNKRRFDAGQDYEYNPGPYHPSQAIFQHTYPEIPNSAITMLNLQNYEAEALTGVKAFAGGLSGEAYGDVATGIKGVLDAASKREMNILRRLAKGIQDIGSKIAAMNAVFLSEEETVRITNEEFVTVRREDLKCNYDLIVDISTPEVDQSKATDLGFMLQTMGPDMDPAMSRMVLAEIARLKRMPALAKAIESYQPQPDPLTEKLKELEIRKLEKEIEKMDSEITKNLAEAQKKASEADMTDLEYLEQETGTNHERALQRQAEQARSLQDLEVTKALLKPRKVEETTPNVEAAVGFNKIVDPYGRI